VPFIAVLLLGFGRTHILDGPVFGGWVTAAIYIFYKFDNYLRENQRKPRHQSNFQHYPVFPSMWAKRFERKGLNYESKNFNSVCGDVDCWIFRSERAGLGAGNGEN
jgi:hypothetical protein